MRMVKIMMNDQLFEGIKKSLMYDLIKVYIYYKQEDEDVRGVTIKFNATEGFGKYIYENTDKLMDVIEYFNKTITFPYKFLFEKEGEIEFYQLIE